jgi:hypothetical protein
VKRLRPVAALAALTLVVALLAPTASAACQARQHRCPRMPPELAALCHKAKTMAPDCCQHERQVPGRSSTTEIGAPALLAVLADATVDVAAVATAGPSPTGAEFSRDARFHELGLFTLHSVFRI